MPTRRHRTHLYERVVPVSRSPSPSIHCIWHIDRRPLALRCMCTCWARLDRVDRYLLDCYCQFGPLRAHPYALRFPARFCTCRVSFIFLRFERFYRWLVCAFNLLIAVHSSVRNAARACTWHVRKGVLERKACFVYLFIPHGFFSNSCTFQQTWRVVFLEPFTFSRRVLVLLIFSCYQTRNKPTYEKFNMHEVLRWKFYDSRM